MPITLNCPKCRKPFRVRDESVGMRVKCPTCGAVLQVPANLSPTSMEGPPSGDSPSGASPASAPSSTTIKPGGTPGPRTAKNADASESVLHDLPAPGPSAGPPSLAPASPTYPLRRSPLDEDNDLNFSRRSAATGPAPSSRRPAPNKTKPAAQGQSEAGPEQLVEEAAGWRGVRGGLRWIQVGLFLTLLYPLYEFGLTAYCFKQYGAIPGQLDQPPAGLFGKPGLNLFQEISALTLVGGAVLCFLFASIGLMKCLRAPECTRTKGVITGTLLFGLLAFAAVAVTIYEHRLGDVLKHFAQLPEVPANVSKVVYPHHLVLVLVSLTVAWYLVFLMQMAIPLRASSLPTSIAYSGLLIVLVYFGVPIANDYYPLISAPDPTVDDKVKIYAIGMAYFAVTSLLISLRLMSMAGTIRKSIRRWLEDNEDALSRAGA